jgi:hypothetical protein
MFEQPEVPVLGVVSRVTGPVVSRVAGGEGPERFDAGDEGPWFDSSDFAEVLVDVPDDAPSGAAAGDGLPVGVVL